MGAGLPAGIASGPGPSQTGAATGAPAARIGVAPVAGTLKVSGPVRALPAMKDPTIKDKDGDLDDAVGLFERWEREGVDGIDSDESPDPTLDEEEPSQRAPIRRTPEQEARRLWFLRGVAALMGFLGVGGLAIFGLRWVSVPQDRADTGAEPSSAAQAPARTGSGPLGAKAAGVPSSGGALSPSAAVPATALLPPVPPTAPVPTTTRETAERAGVLPGLDLQRPLSNDPAVERAWSQVEQGLRDQDFKRADEPLAQLAKRPDTATKETARLARALLWSANGRGDAVRSVVADLAANAATPEVRRRAKELQSQSGSGH